MELETFAPKYLPALRLLYLQSRRETFTWLNTESFMLADFDRDTLGERIWLVKVSGKVVGFISIWEPDNFIHHLYVAAEYHNRGIGSKLLEVGISNYMDLSLKCMARNIKALKFYKSHGFTKVSKVDDASGGYYLMRFNAPI